MSFEIILLILLAEKGQSETGHVSDLELENFKLWDWEETTTRLNLFDFDRIPKL